MVWYNGEAKGALPAPTGGDKVAEDEGLEWLDQLLNALQSVSNPQALLLLALALEEADLDALEAAAEARLASLEAEADPGLRERLEDLRRLRTEGLADVRPAWQAALHALSGMNDRLQAWIETPDWAASERFLAGEGAALLSDEGEAALELLQAANLEDERVTYHLHLLRRCRALGVAAAYAERRQAHPEPLSPLQQAVILFMQADEAAAAHLLRERTDLLLTLEGRETAAQLVAAARQHGDASLTAQLERRLALWDRTWGERAGRARRPADRQPDNPDPAMQLERQPLAGERGTRYHVVTARNCAIGDNASVLNIYDVGALPLRWQQPRETQPGRAAEAVGRATDLEKLHQRLQSGDYPSLVGVRGLAGVGKTTLAALYATRYQAAYPGGVIWLTVGPGVRQREEVVPLWQRLAAYAYGGDVRAAWLDDILFEVEVVQMLLAGHGRLLLVLDDVWGETVAQALRDAAPPGSAVLLTTRDARVAYALQNSPVALYELDVLTPEDARALLQRRAPGLPDDLANQVAQGLGRHAQALALAGAALYFRKPHRYPQTAQELLARVAAGTGFGDLPHLDRAEAEARVEIALKHSYDYLGEDPSQGAQRQAALRALGSMAPEADFDAAAAAALWQVSLSQAEELLLLFDQLALVQEQEGGGRWQQHVILRAYGLGLQIDAERLMIPARYADYYLSLSEAAYRATPRRADEVAKEFLQIEHAFRWCQHHSLTRSIRFTQVLSDFMRNRGRVGQLNEWLTHSLAAADQVGNRLGKANTLQSLGDLERRLGNVAAARGHYDAALPLYEAEQARLGKANTLKSLGDLESRLGNVAAARGHYDAALPLYEAEQDPVGKMNVFLGQARLAASQADIGLARHLFEQVFAIADQIGFGDHPVIQNLRREYAQLDRLQT